MPRLWCRTPEREAKGLAHFKTAFGGDKLQELAEAQGVKPINNPKKLLGGWIKDEDFDAFLARVEESIAWGSSGVRHWEYCGVEAREQNAE